MLNLSEAATVSGQSKAALWRAVNSGRLPATKRGNTYYVDVMHLEGVAVEMGTSSIGPVPLDDLGTWLAEVDHWKAGRVGTAVHQTASDLVIEDRRARR